MIELVLQRVSKSKYGMFGTISDNGNRVCDTLERLPLNNAADISAILAGSYICLPAKSPKFPYIHYALQDVPGREAILIHKGNTIIDTHGCILVGQDSTEQGIWHSGDALALLTTAYPDGFMLTIKD